MKIPTLDLVRQYESIREEMDDAILEVVRSGKFVLGPFVRAFEEAAAEYCGVRHAIGVASGTDALLLSLKALGIGSGDGVIIPSFTFFATAGVVYNIGGTPVFADIDPKTFNLDPEDVRRILTAHHELRTANHKPLTEIKAIIPVHLYGQMADMDEITAIAQEYDLAVIEDAAQAIGATYSSKMGGNREAQASGHKPRTANREPVIKAGTIGRLGCFSFYPTKNLGAYGDGGMVITNDDELAERMRLLRVHGSKPKYYHHIVGANSRLDALQAAILRAKLPHLDQWSQARRERAAYYDQLLNDVEGIETPYVASDRTHIYHQYTIRVKDGRRDKLRVYLKERGIGTEVYYPLPLHLQECFSDLGYHEGDLRESEWASREVLSLPVFPELKEKELAYVIKHVQAFSSKSDS